MAQIPKRQLLSEFLRHLDQATRARLRDDEGPPGSWVDSLQISVDELFAVLDHTLTNVLGRKFGYQADIRLQNLVDLVSDVELRDDPRAVRLATRCLAECPPEIKGKKTADWLHKLLTQCIIRSATPPSEAARADLIKAEARGDLIWSVRLLSATCLFPHEAESLRRRIRQTNFKSEKTMGYIQDWTLRFAADSSFLETWGQLFKRANYDQRRRLMERAVTSEGADDVLRGLAWIRTRKVLGPTAGYAAFAAAHKVPASGLFLAWYAIHGPGEAQMEVLAALENHQGPHIEEAVQLLARESLVPEVQARAAERLTQGVTGPRPKDPLSLAVSRILNDASDPGGLDFGERQLIGYAWREAFDRPGAAPLQEAQRRRLVALAHGLIDTLEGDSPPADPTTWYEYSTRIFSRGPWAGRTDTRDLFIRAWRQTARESLHSDTLGRLWNAAEEGWQPHDERLADALELDHTRDTTDRWLRAKLRLPRTDVPFRSHVRSGQLGDAPPVGLQRHVLAQRPDNAARSALVTLYEVSNETQRRGLLLALEPPVDPGFVPVIEAIATQGAPQTAAAAVRALGRCGPWAVNGFLHGLRDQQKGLDDIIDEALEALKERHADAGDAGAGALALADTGGGELAIATDEAGDEDGDGPTDTAVTLRLAPDNPFDRMASPPRSVPFLGQLLSWVLAGNRWNILWSWLLAMGIAVATGPRARVSAWLWLIVIGGIGLVANHWLSGTWARLRLWRRGRTTWAEETARTSRRGKGRSAGTTYYYTYAFVAEDGRTYTIKDSATERRASSTGADIQVLYLPTENGGAGLRHRAVLGPLVLGSDGVLRTRWRSLFWGLVVLLPWLFVAQDALGRLFGR